MNCNVRLAQIKTMAPLLLTLWTFFAVMINLGLPCEGWAEIYVRIHLDGAKEFTNRPSGSGWMFHMTESGFEPASRRREGIYQQAFRFGMDVSHDGIRI